MQLQFGWYCREKKAEKFSATPRDLKLLIIGLSLSKYIFIFQCGQSFIPVLPASVFSCSFSHLLSTVVMLEPEIIFFKFFFSPQQLVSYRPFLYNFKMLVIRSEQLLVQLLIILIAAFSATKEETCKCTKRDIRSPETSCLEVNIQTTAMSSWYGNGKWWSQFFKG